MESWARDFADLHRYQAANQEIGDPISGEHRVVFDAQAIEQMIDYTMKRMYG